MMPEEIIILEDPEKIKIAIDPTRRKILELLRMNALAVSQMASILDKDQSTIYRHVEKLVKAGFVEQSGERKEHHIPEKIFSRTAKIFFFSPGIGTLSGEEAILKHHKKMVDKTSKLMEKMGYEPTPDSDKASDEFYMEIDSLVQSKIMEIGSDTELDFNTLRRLRIAIIINEIYKNEKIGELARAYADSFI